MMGQRRGRLSEERRRRHLDGVKVHPLEKAMLRSIAILCALMALSGLDCAKPPPPPAEPALDPSHFSGERAWRHLERLVEIGPRVSGTPEVEAARRYIRAELEAIGLEAKPLSFAIGSPRRRRDREGRLRERARSGSRRVRRHRRPRRALRLEVLRGLLPRRRQQRRLRCRPASRDGAGAERGSASLYGLARLPGRRRRPFRGHEAGRALPGKSGAGRRDRGGCRALPPPSDGVLQSGRRSGSRDRERSSLRASLPQRVPARRTRARSRVGLLPG
jgi:hypothetical protein